MIQAVIFDMDGLMFDREGVWLKSWDIALAEKGLPMHPQLFSSIAGAGRDRCIEVVRSLYHGSYAAVEVAKNHHAIAKALFKDEGAPAKEGLLELLGYLDASTSHLIRAKSQRRLHPMSGVSLQSKESSCHSAG